MTMMKSSPVNSLRKNWICMSCGNPNQIGTPDCDSCGNPRNSGTVRTGNSQHMVPIHNQGNGNVQNNYVVVHGDVNNGMDEYPQVPMNAEPEMSPLGKFVLSFIRIVCLVIILPIAGFFLWFFFHAFGVIFDFLAWGGSGIFR
jgi:hypothetical protein